MGRNNQKNWLVIITVILSLSGLTAIYLKFKDPRKQDGCFENGVYYNIGDIVQTSSGRSDCYCSQSKEIVCENKSVDSFSDGFSSDGLTFKSAYLNLLDKSVPNSSRIVLKKVNHSGSKLSVSFEREVMCNSDEVAPDQAGYYALKENRLILGTITNQDKSLYTKACVVSNTFDITNIQIPNIEAFTIMYRNDEGRLFDLPTCYYNGNLYEDGDVIKGLDAKSLCDCRNGVVECSTD